jgi:hypothetical protein
MQRNLSEINTSCWQGSALQNMTSFTMWIRKRIVRLSVQQTCLRKISYNSRLAEARSSCYVSRVRNRHSRNPTRPLYSSGGLSNMPSLSAGSVKFVSWAISELMMCEQEISFEILTYLMPTHVPVLHFRFQKKSRVLNDFVMELFPPKFTFV